jgi:cytoskeletal protein CcmA (bactofilin family)
LHVQAIRILRFQALFADFPKKIIMAAISCYDSRPTDKARTESLMFDKRKDSQQGDSALGREQERPVSQTAVTASMGKSALIGAGITVTGDISGTENLVIEGRVEGKIDLSGNQVMVGQSGKVHADVVAKVVKIEGEVQGDIDGKEKVVITKSGDVRGNISAPRVMLEDGALFKGSIDINPADSAVAELPLPSKPAVAPKPAADTASKEPGFTSN